MGNEHSNYKKAVSEDGTRIDFYGNDNDFILFEPKTFTEAELRKVSDDDVIALLQSNISTLVLRGCTNLTDKVLLEVAKKCSSLSQLNVRECENLTDAAIVAIAENCPSLTQLNVDACYNLTDEAIVAIAKNCSSLTQLNVSGCRKLTDAAIVAIAENCSSLTQLNVEVCRNLTDEAIMAIAENCSSLIQLNLFGCRKVTDAAIVAIAKNFSSLTQLNVDAYNLTDAAIVAIAKNCPSLTQLDVWDCKNLTDAAIVAIAENCPSLTQLNVDACYNLTEASIVANLTDAAIVAIAENCSSLTQLNVGGCTKLTDAAIVAIAENCSSLTQLKVAYCRKLTDAAIVAIAKNCSSLTQLDVGVCKKLTDAAIVAIAKNCSSLTQLHVSQCKKLTDAAIVAIAKNCSSLTQLKVSSCYKLTDASIAAIAKNRSSLTQLKVAYCRKLTDAAIVAIAKNCSSLTQLNVESCKNLTDAAIVAIAKNCSSLTQLNVGLCENLTDAAIVAIAKNCSSLTQLHVRGCNNLTDAAIVAIAENCFSLKKLYPSNCNFTTLPRSIVPLMRRGLEVDFDYNPLQEPPKEIVRQGPDAIERYFDELDRGLVISKQLKLVLIGDGGAGKTSLRNALARRENPKQTKDARTILLDLERVEINEKLELNIFDFGGQREYLASQLPYIKGPDLYFLVVPADNATDEHFERLVERFFILLQARAPNAVLVPVLTKIDLVKDHIAKERRAWLHDKAHAWLEDARLSAERRQVKFSPLRLHEVVYGVSVDKIETIDELRNVIVKLAGPPLLPTVGQKIPQSWISVWKLLGAVAEFGNEEVALTAIHEETVRPLSEVDVASVDGAYRSEVELRKLWREKLQGDLEIFNDALRLLEAQGGVYVDCGLVFLQPDFVSKIVKALLNHKLAEYVKSPNEQLYEALHDFGLQGQELAKFKQSLERYVEHGDLRGDLLSFLWRHLPIRSQDYKNIIRMLIKSGVIIRVQSEDDKTSAVDDKTRAVVPFFLPEEKPSDDFSKAWPTKPNADEVQLEMVAVFYPPGLPTGLPERFAAEVHRFGQTVLSWKDGAVVIPSKNVRILATSLSHDEGPSLVFTVRSAKMTASQSWSWLLSAMTFLKNECKEQFPGLDFSTNLACPMCLSKGVNENETELFPWDGEDASKGNYTCKRYFEIASFPSCAEDGCDNRVAMKSDIDALTEIVLRIENKIESVYSLAKALANEQNKYPNLFYILPVTTENGKGQNLLEKVGLAKEYQIIFVCAKSGKPVPYYGEEGLVFSMPSEFARGALKFWKKYGPMIKLSTILISMAIKASTGVNTSDLIPSDLIPPSVSKFVSSAEEYATAVDKVMGKAGIEFDFSLESDFKNLEQSEVYKEAVGTNYPEFCDFLDTIKFSRRKLPMKIDSDGEGGWWWVFDEESIIGPISSLKKSLNNSAPNIEELSSASSQNAKKQRCKKCKCSLS